MTPVPGGFGVSQPVYPAPESMPDGTESIGLLASSIRVREDESARYGCFGFRWPASDRRLIRCFETVIDIAHVVHHIVLYEVSNDVDGGEETNFGVTARCGCLRLGA